MCLMRSESSSQWLVPTRVPVEAKLRDDPPRCALIHCSTRHRREFMLWGLEGAEGIVRMNAH